MTFLQLIIEQFIHLFDGNKVYNYGREDFINEKKTITTLFDIQYLEAQAQFIEDFTMYYLEYMDKREMIPIMSEKYREIAKKYAEVLYNSGLRSDVIDELRK